MTVRSQLPCSANTLGQSMLVALAWASGFGRGLGIVMAKRLFPRAWGILHQLLQGAIVTLVTACTLSTPDEVVRGLSSDLRCPILESIEMAQ